MFSLFKRKKDPQKKQLRSYVSKLSNDTSQYLKVTSNKRKSEHEDFMKGIRSEVNSIKKDTQKILGRK